MVNFNHFSTKGRECITAAFHAAQNGGHADITPPIMMVTLLTEAADMVQYLLNHLHIDREAFKRDVAWLMASLRRNQTALFPRTAISPVLR